MTIEIYAFEDKNGNSVSDYTTRSLTEARAYAQDTHCRIIALIFEYSDSELVESYADGDPFNSEGEDIGEDEDEEEGNTDAPLGEPRRPTEEVQE